MDIFTAKRILQGREIVLYGIDSGAGVYALVLGGDRPHAGASAAADPCILNEKKTVSLSSFSLHGHKDDELCRLLAKKLSVSLGCPAIVSGGIHFDRVDGNSIQEILDVADELGNAYIQHIRERKESGDV